MSQSEPAEREALQREVLETRHAVIRMDHSIRQLSGEVKALSRAQQRQVGGRWWHSSVTYVLIGGLATLAAFSFARAALEGHEREAVQQRARLADLERRVSTLGEALEQQQRSEREAYAFYELVAAGRREEAIERFATLEARVDNRAVLALLRNEVQRFRFALAQETYDAGNRFFEAEQWAEARDAYARSRAYVEHMPFGGALAFRLAETLYRLRDYANAWPHYEQAVESGVLSRQDQATAIFRWAESLERVGQRERAEELYGRFLRGHSRHPWAGTAEQRRGALLRQRAGE